MVLLDHAMASQDVSVLRMLTKRSSPPSMEKSNDDEWTQDLQKPTRAMPADIPPHWKEIINLQKRLTDILHVLPFKDGARVSPEDEVVVRDVLKYHQNYDEKIGPGIDHIKIKRIRNKTTICFWIERVDGTEIAFSYHKCLREKAAKECPDLLPHYDALFKSFRRL